MDKKTCESCFKEKTVLVCNDCESPSCKKCSCFIDEDEFEYPELLPERFRDQVFCPSCYNEHAAPVLADYRDILERAKVVDVYDKEQGSETGLIRRVEKPISIKDCDDREETLLRLAFYAAQKGFDTLVDVDITSKKIGKGTYKKLIWNGTAVPVDPKIRM